MEEKQTSECLNIRYFFTLDVPLSKQVNYNNQATIKVSGVVSWQNGTDIKKIQQDLEARYNKLQEELNKEVITNPSVNLTWDGNRWV